MCRRISQRMYLESNFFRSELQNTRQNICSSNKVINQISEFNWNKTFFLAMQFYEKVSISFAMPNKFSIVFNCFHFVVFCFFFLKQVLPSSFDQSCNRFDTGRRTAIARTVAPAFASSNTCNYCHSCQGNNKNRKWTKFANKNCNF